MNRRAALISLQAEPGVLTFLRTREYPRLLGVLGCKDMHPRDHQGRGHEWNIGVTSIPLVLPISIYGGYFGAGAGTLLLGVLMIATEGDYRRANVAKNLVSSLNTLAASVWFIANGAVSWPHTLVMAVGCLAGAFCGAHLARRVPQAAMRVVIVVVGAALTAVFAWKYWF